MANSEKRMRKIGTLKGRGRKKEGKKEAEGKRKNDWS